MRLVADASILLAWMLPDETGPALDKLLDRDDLEIVMPFIGWYELRNVLIVNVRRRRLSTRQTDAILSSLDDLGIVFDHSPDSAFVLNLCFAHPLSVYDAAYIELAKRLSLPLATLDHPLCIAAKAAGVDVITLDVSRDT